MISESKKRLIVLLMRYDSRKFIESVMALLDTESEVERILQFAEKNPNASKTDIHEQIVKMKYSKK